MGIKRKLENFIELLRKEEQEARGGITITINPEHLREVNDLRHFGMLCRDPLWVIIRMEVYGEEVTGELKGDLPLGDCGPLIGSDFLDYAIYRTVGLKLGEMTEFLEKHRVKFIIVVRDSESQQWKPLVILWDGQEYRVLDEDVIIDIRRKESDSV